MPAGGRKNQRRAPTNATLQTDAADSGPCCHSCKCPSGLQTQRSDEVASSQFLSGRFYWRLHIRICGQTCRFACGRRPAIQRERSGATSISPFQKEMFFTLFGWRVQLVPGQTSPTTFEELAHRLPCLAKSDQAASLCTFSQRTFWWRCQTWSSHPTVRAQFDVEPMQGLSVGKSLKL